MLARYWHTIRYLKPVQILGRIWFRFYRPRINTRVGAIVTGNASGWSRPACRECSLAGPGRFEFLGESGDLERIGWEGPQKPILWRYNQHYFDDLNAEAADGRSQWHNDLLRAWVAANPPGKGVGWEPYPTSLRIVNWIKWSLTGHVLPQECRESLVVQTRWLAKRLEVHLLGNHLFANAKALVFAGAYFQGPEARQWLERGLRILRRQVPEQILPDGGHFERSTMYHALALEDMLDLYNLTQTRLAGPRLTRQTQQWATVIPPMLAWLVAMSHPDGGIAFFNDAALGIAPANAELLAYAGRLGFPVPDPYTRDAIVWLKDSGYVSVSLAEAHKAILDVAPVGPDYLPGHAHADTLSFELSLFGRRIFVNSGTSLYGASAERLRQRGTAAHNTLELDGEDSSQVWSGFRVARRARVLGVRVDERADGVRVSASHDGYTRLPGRNRHTRAWHMDGEGMRITDEVSGPFDVARVRFHVHPDIRFEAVDEHTYEARLPSGHTLIVRFEGAANSGLRPASWHPRFGQSIPGQCLEAEMTAASLQTCVLWKEAE